MFAVFEVYGFARGSLTLLAVYPYRDQQRAYDHAERMQGGYVLRSRTAEQIHNRVEYATGDAIPATQPEIIITEEDVKNAMAKSQPVACVRTRMNGWTG